MYLVKWQFRYTRMPRKPHLKYDNTHKQTIYKALSLQTSTNYIHEILTKSCDLCKISNVIVDKGIAFLYTYINIYLYNCRICLTTVNYNICA